MIRAEGKEILVFLACCAHQKSDHMHIKHVFFFLLQLVMYQIPFARVACLVQRTMGAADVNRSCSSFFEEKACASMENVCIPAHPGTMDIEPQI